jgi:hypothetical protein
MFQLGIFKHDDKDGSAYPLSVSALLGSKAIQVECGAYHTIVLTAEKEVFTWGKGAHGRLGHGSEENEVLPRRVESLRKLNIVSVAAGYDHSAAVSADGSLLMWGHGEWYQLGTGKKKNMLEPTLIEIDTSVKQVSCGGSNRFGFPFFEFHSMAQSFRCRVSQRGSRLRRHLVHVGRRNVRGSRAWRRYAFSSHGAIRC